MLNSNEHYLYASKEFLKRYLIRPGQLVRITNNSSHGSDGNPIHYGNGTIDTNHSIHSNRYSIAKVLYSKEDGILTESNASIDELPSILQSNSQLNQPWMEVSSLVALEMGMTDQKQWEYKVIPNEDHHYNDNIKQANNQWLQEQDIQQASNITLSIWSDYPRCFMDENVNWLMQAAVEWIRADGEENKK